MKINIKKLLAEVLKRIQPIGNTYTASWTATSSNANNQRVTDSITLPTGTYILSLKIPVCSQESTLAFSVDPIGMSAGGIYAKGQTIITSVATLSAQTTIYGVTNMSHSTSYTYTERGYLKAVRIA